MIIFIRQPKVLWMKPNDAIGYIEPDPEFVMAGMKYSEENDEFDTDTWCLISFGEHTASNVAGKFVELYESVQ